MINKILAAEFGLDAQTATEDQLAEKIIADRKAKDKQLADVAALAEQSRKQVRDMQFNSLLAPYQADLRIDNKPETIAEYRKLFDFDEALCKSMLEKLPKNTNMTREVGAPGGTVSYGQTAVKFLAEVDKVRLANPKLSFDQAQQLVQNAHPQMYEEWCRETYRVPTNYQAGGMPPLGAGEEVVN